MDAMTTDAMQTTDDAMSVPESPSMEEVLETQETAPTPDPVPAESGITPDGVTSEKAPPASLPDSSLISDRISKMANRNEAIDQRREQEQEHARLKKEVETLRLLQGGAFQTQYDATKEKVEHADDDQSMLMKELRGELNKMKAGQDKLRGELEKKQEDAEMYDAQTQVSSWIKQQEEHFPLINHIGQQQLVFQRMLNERARTGTIPSEAQSGREVEAELVRIVEACAPLLGYAKGDEATRREESVSVGAGNMSVAGGVDLGELSENDAINALVSQYEKTNR